MSFVSHYFEFLKTWRFAMALLAVAGVFAFAFLLNDFESKPLSANIEVPPVTNAVAWSQLPSAQSFDWNIFCLSGGDSQAAEGSLASAFRFAGTFFVSGDSGGEVRRAVLCVIADERQVIASEGDTIDGVVVDKIGADSVILRRGDETAELRLSFASGNQSATGVGESAASGKDTAARFGKTLSKNSWELRRSSLMEYYNEMLDDPERLLNLFDSLKPLYNDNGSITGYQLGIEGEREFFESVGLREGDVVRKVNSLPMTRRSRAEFFIKQVASDKINAIVIDVERDGKPERLIYQIK